MHDLRGYNKIKEGIYKLRIQGEYGMSKVDLKIQGEKKDIEKLLNIISNSKEVKIEAASEPSTTNVSFARLEIEEQ